MRIQYTILVLALGAVTLMPGCVSTGGRNMETVVTDMHQRVTLLDEGLEPSLAELNENAAALIQRVNENERQMRLLTSLIEENQHKIDNLLKMLADLKSTLYRHWGISESVRPPRGSTSGTGIEIVPPTRSNSDGGDTAAAAPPVVVPSESASSGDLEVYNRAKEHYDQEDYAASESAFSAFLQDYPRSDQRHKAQFWLGKTLLNQSEYSRAIRAFEVLRRDFPDSSYMAFALHNQAVGHFRLGERDEAIALMEEVVANYPTSTAAAHAERDLKQLRGRE